MLVSSRGHALVTGAPVSAAQEQVIRAPRAALGAQLASGGGVGDRFCHGGLVCGRGVSWGCKSRGQVEGRGGAGGSRHSRSRLHRHVGHGLGSSRGGRCRRGGRPGLRKQVRKHGTQALGIGCSTASTRGRGGWWEPRGGLGLRRLGAGPDRDVLIGGPLRHIRPKGSSRWGGGGAPLYRGGVRDRGGGPRGGGEAAPLPKARAVLASRARLASASSSSCKHAACVCGTAGTG